MMVALRAASLVLLCGMVFPARSAAQRVPSPFRYIETTQSLGAFGGYLNAATTLNIGQERFEVGPQPAPIFGLRYEIRFEGPLGGEVALGYVPSERFLLARDTTPGSTAPATTVATATLPLLLVEGGARFQLTGPRTYRGLAPYVIAAGGLLIDIGGDNDDGGRVPPEQQLDFGPAFTVAGGIGTELFVSERVSLRVEARDQAYRLRIVPGLRRGATDDVTQWKNNPSLSLGAAYHF